MLYHLHPPSKKASHVCEALWAQQGSNLRPKDYESPTLTS